MEKQGNIKYTTEKEENVGIGNAQCDQEWFTFHTIARQPNDIDHCKKKAKEADTKCLDVNFH